MHTTTLRTPADVVAAAAGLLGFAPTNSIVAYMLHRDTTHGLIVRSAIRFDVTITAEQAANFPATCNLRPDTNHAAILLAVCDQRHDWHAVTVLDSLREALSGAGIVITSDVALRDAMISAAFEHPQAGAELWTHIARRLRGRARAEALTIAAVCYCLLGDGIRAGIATDIALNEAQASQAPPPRLALLLLTALRSGIPPQQIRRVITDTTKPSQD